MRALLLSPDYVSHYFPLSALGRELRSRGYDVLVATGPTLRSRRRAGRDSATGSSSSGRGATQA